MITITIDNDTNHEEIALYGQALQAISDLRAQQHATAQAERDELLSDLFEKLSSERMPVEETAAPAKKSRKAKEPVAETPAPVASPVQVSETAPEQASPTNEPAPAAAEPAPPAAVDAKQAMPAYTLEFVRALLTDISRNGKTAEVKALLQSFGKEKLTDIEAEHYPALVEKAKAL